MNQSLPDVVQRHYPHLNFEERGELLWGATCFPFGDVPTIEKQLIELRKNTDGTLLAALAFADAELRRIMGKNAHEKSAE